MHFTNHPKPNHLLEQVFAFDNDTWRVIGIGVTDADGFTAFHLASTTRFRQQRNGFIPVQRLEWLHQDMLQACAVSSEAA
jgi:hypothetical protein